MASFKATAEVSVKDLPEVRELVKRTQEVIQLCNRYAQPGASPAIHEFAYKILKILGEREDGK